MAESVRNSEGTHLCIVREDKTMNVIKIMIIIVCCGATIVEFLLFKDDLGLGLLAHAMWGAQGTVLLIRSEGLSEESTTAKLQGAVVLILLGFVTLWCVALREGEKLGWR